LKTKQKIRNL